MIVPPWAGEWWNGVKPCDFKRLAQFNRSFADHVNAA
jgi:hypothetical protein